MKLALILSTVILQIFAWNYDKSGVDWKGSCSASKGQSPVNINQPFAYQVPNIKFNYIVVQGASLVNDGNNLKLLADFGYVEYKGVVYNAQEMYILSPSEHTFGPSGTHYAIQAQIVHTNREKKYLVLSILFSIALDQPGIFLTKLGFDSQDLRNLGVNERIPVRQGVNLQDTLSKTTRYVAYDGSLSRPPCTADAEWIIIVDTIRASKLQISNFPHNLKHHMRTVQSRSGRNFRSSVEKILKEKGQPPQVKTRANGQENRSMMFQKLYYDLLIINRQKNVNSTEAAKIKQESILIDTDFPKYGVKTEQPKPKPKVQKKKEELTPQEMSAFKHHMKEELKKALFNKAPSLDASKMKDGSQSTKQTHLNQVSSQTGTDFLNSFITGESPGQKQGTSLLQLGFREQESEKAVQLIEEKDQLESMLEVISLGEYLGSVLKPAGNAGTKSNKTALPNISNNNLYLDTSSWPTVCKLGVRQSPINVMAPFYPDPNPILMAFSVPPGNTVKLRNDGYKIIAEADFGRIQFGSHPFLVHELYLHHPSEHTFGANEVASAFELQIITKDTAGSMFAIALIFDEKPDIGSDFLGGLGLGLLGSTPRLTQAGQSVTYNGSNLDLTQLIGKVYHFVTYEGSMTSPPCREGVQWAIAMKKFPISSLQLSTFKTMTGWTGNARKSVAGNGRIVKLT